MRIFFVTVPHTGNRFFLLAFRDLRIEFKHAQALRIGGPPLSHPLITTIRNPALVCASWIAYSGDATPFDLLLLSWANWARYVLPFADAVLSVDDEPEQRAARAFEKLPELRRELNFAHREGEKATELRALYATDRTEFWRRVPKGVVEKMAAQIELPESYAECLC